MALKLEMNSLQSCENNKKQLQYVQDFTGLLFGCAAGVLKLESSTGFAGFLLQLTIVNCLFISLITQFTPSKYFESPVKNIFIDNFMRNSAAFLMMWTLIYALV